MQCSTFISDVADFSTNYIKIKYKMNDTSWMQFFFRQYLHQQECNHYTKEKICNRSTPRERILHFLYQYRAPLNERNKFRERVTTCEWLNIFLAKYICACKICSIHPTHSVCQQLHTLLIYTFWKAIGSYHRRQYRTIFMDRVEGMFIKIIIKLFMLFVLQDHCYIPYMIKPIYIDAIVYIRRIRILIW